MHPNLFPTLCVACLTAWLVWQVLGHWRHPSSARPMRNRRRRPRVAHDITRLAPAGARKPAWVADEVLRLAVHLQGCRSVAVTFNRLHGSRASVGKTWVNELCNARAAELLAMRRAMRARVPRPCPVGERWALDLTFIPAAAGPSRAVLGIIDQWLAFGAEVEIVAPEVHVDAARPSLPDDRSLWPTAVNSHRQRVDVHQQAVAASVQDCRHPASGTSAATSGALGKTGGSNASSGR